MLVADAKPGTRVRVIDRVGYDNGVITDMGVYQGSHGYTFVRCKFVMADGYVHEDGWSPGALEVVEEAKSEDPRTPEKIYADTVDELLHTYAGNLKSAMDRGTMAWPYSHIGIFAEFLMEYEKIDKP